MRKLLYIIGVYSLLLGQQIQAQEAVDPVFEYKMAKKKVENSDAAIKDAKKNVMAKTWLLRGQAMLDGYEVHTKNLYNGMLSSSLPNFLRQPKEVQKETIDGAVVESNIYEWITVRVSGGTVVDWEVTQRVADGAPTKAFEAFKKAMELDAKGKVKPKVLMQVPRLKKQLFEEATVAYSKQDYVSAANLFKTATMASSWVNPNSKDTTSIYNTGMAYFRNADVNRKEANYKLAVEHLLLALDVDKTNEDIYFYLSECYKSLNDDEKQLEILHMAFENKPTTTIINSLVDYYLQRKILDKALEFINIGLGKEPNNSLYYVIKGDILNHKEDEAGSIASYKKAVEMDENQWKAYYNLGINYYNKSGTFYDEAKDLPLSKQKEYDALIAKAEAAQKDAYNQFINCKKSMIRVNDSEAMGMLPSTLETIIDICTRLKSNMPEFADKQKEAEAELAQYK